MSQSAIPNEFTKYLQDKIAAGKSPDMNEMIFAFIPGLDPTKPIDPTKGLPPSSQWVHNQDIDQVGKVGNDALAYSVIVPASEPSFTFNAIYMHDKHVNKSCGMVVHKISETKETNATITKTLMQAYSGAAKIANITIDAATWQIDFQSRLVGIDEDLRLTCFDNVGHASFISGFDVIQQADKTKYKVTAGTVYIGGLRTQLEGDTTLTITKRPNGIYLDTHRAGAVTSKWVNKLSIRVSQTTLTDYIDGAGIQHYVTKLATINANGTVSLEQANPEISRGLKDATSFTDANISTTKNAKWLMLLSEQVGL